MEGTLRPIRERRLHDPNAQLTACSRVLFLVDLELTPAQQLAQGIDLIEAEVVARHDAHARSCPQCSKDAGLQQVEARLRHERGDDGDVGCVCKQWPELRSQRVTVAAGREGLLACDAE
jgi:hypothetical protein